MISVKKEGVRSVDKQRERKTKDIKKERKKQNTKVHFDRYIAKPLQSSLAACDGQQQWKELIGER